MTISGMNYGFYGFDYNNSIKNNINASNDKVNVNNSELDKSNQNVDANVSAQASDEGKVSVKAPKILAEGQLEDFTFDFKKSKEFSMKGEDSNITSLDITNDIADVKKDDLLDQYRFFAASESSPVQYQSDEGMVMRVNRG